MKRAALHVFLAVAALIGAPGCAVEEDAGGREATYPVGYTPPAELSAAQPAALAPGRPQPYAAPTQPGSPAPEVVVGDEDAQAAAGPAGAPGPEAPDEYSDTDPAALSDFRTALDPYGTWQEDPTYGTVWVPSPSVVGDDFTPYVSAGHWEYGDDYVWASDYSWGWAPFHYGRWAYGPAGWEWIPGRVYAGAWVSWRYGVGDWAYVGWAPLSPYWGWRGGVAVGLGFVPYAPYAFVPSAHLFAPAVGAHLVTGAAVGPIASHTQPWAPASSANRVAAKPTVSGPPPSTLHIQSASVVRASATTAGLAQARAYSRPSSAMSLGARAPQAYSGTSRAVASSTTYAGAGARSSYSLGQQSHFGGKLGAGFAGSAASAPPVRSAPSYSAGARYAAPYSASSVQSYRSSAPSYRGPEPSYHSGYAGASSGGFHGGGGGGGFHGGSHSGGGGHGGGHR